MEDLTIVAVPGFFATMGLENAVLRRRAARLGPSPADYERRDTLTSLTMGLGSLAAPYVLPRLLAPITPGRGRYGRALVLTAAGAAAVTTLADRLARLEADEEGPTGAHRPPPTAWRQALPRPDEAAALSNGSTRPSRVWRRRVARAARRVASVGGVATIVAGGTAITSAWTAATTATRLWPRRILPDLGSGPLALAAALLGWDLAYYWNHRFMHESRYMWAIHVVHHSSQRYNLSTALRQPVADAFGTFLPYGGLALLGIRPKLIARARELDLLYQYWIHTDTIRTLGPTSERVFNTPSHHRVHHGSNRQYLDRNHAGIFILWDRWFGTFEPEQEPVVYGLTKNIGTFNPVRVATHEHADMLRDVARSTTWRDRLSHVLRGPGWADQRSRAVDGRGADGVAAAGAAAPAPVA